MDHSKHAVRRCAIYTRKSSEEGPIPPGQQQTHFPRYDSASDASPTPENHADPRGCSQAVALCPTIA